MRQILDKVPAPVARLLRTRFGKHLSRFAVVALLSLATSQIVLIVAYLMIGTGGAATLLGWLAGAAVSYALSRKAWDRKGRPDLLRETLPFWTIAGGTAIVLTTAGHLAGDLAKDHHLAKLEATAVVAATVLAANVLTFIVRFVILHYVLFADPRRKSAGKGAGKGSAPANPADGESLAPVAVPTGSACQQEDPSP
jgi:hypothetical protein